MSIVERKNREPSARHAARAHDQRERILERELIAALLPDILVKGADWAHWIAGRDEVEAAGGKVEALKLEPGYSTTGIVEKLLARN